jgi:hypothetical protein
MTRTSFNILDAAKLYGMSRNTIYKSLKENKISKNEHGEIELVELLRVYGEIPTKPNENTTEHESKKNREHKSTQPNAQSERDFELLYKTQELDAARREMQMLREQLSEAKAREDFYQAQLSNVTETMKRLEPPKPSILEHGSDASTASAVVNQKPRGLLDRLFSGG